MKRILDHRSKRWGYDGWVVWVKGSPKPLDWTFSTTRREAREVRASLDRDLFQRTEVVKVKLEMYRA